MTEGTIVPDFDPEYTKEPLINSSDKNETDEEIDADYTATPQLPEEIDNAYTTEPARNETSDELDPGFNPIPSINETNGETDPNQNDTVGNQEWENVPDSKETLPSKFSYSIQNWKN